MYDFKAKDKNLAQYNNYTLSKTLSMFEYMGLPETIPSRELEKMLQKVGYAFVTEVEGNLYAFTGGIGGEQDVYGNPTTITINNVALGFNKTLNIAEDGVLIYNDDMMCGLLPLLNKYNSALVENDINVLLVGYNSRMQTLLSASDDKTKASAEEFLNRMVGGDIGVIGEAAMFDGVKSHNAGANQGNAITALIEFHQYIKGGLNNEIGLKSNFNMKRERLTSGEIDSVDDELYPFVDNMMKCRMSAIEEINSKYSLSVEIDYGSIWNKKNRELVDDVIEEKGESPLTLNESSQESSSESSKESLTESSNAENDPVPGETSDGQPGQTSDDEIRELLKGNASEQLEILRSMLEEENVSIEDVQLINEMIEEYENETK